MILKKYKSQGNAVEATLNSKEENSRQLSGFRPRIRSQLSRNIDFFSLTVILIVCPGSNCAYRTVQSFFSFSFNWVMLTSVR